LDEGWAGKRLVSSKKDGFIRYRGRGGSYGRGRSCGRGPAVRGGSAPAVRRRRRATERAPDQE